MRFFVVLLITSGIAVNFALAQDLRRPVFQPMMTPWGKEISTESVLAEYPRPQIVRSDWLNLNGLWDFRITRLDHTNVDVFKGHILVPFPVESVLSGVKEVFTPQEQMWYQRTFKIPKRRQAVVLLYFPRLLFPRLNSSRLASITPSVQNAPVTQFDHLNATSDFRLKEIWNSQGTGGPTFSKFDCTNDGFGRDQTMDARDRRQHTHGDGAGLWF